MILGSHVLDHRIAQSYAVGAAPDASLDEPLVEIVKESYQDVFVEKTHVDSSFEMMDVAASTVGQDLSSFLKLEVIVETVLSQDLLPEVLVAE